MFRCSYVTVLVGRMCVNGCKQSFTRMFSLFVLGNQKQARLCDESDALFRAVRLKTAIQVNSRLSSAGGCGDDFRRADLS